jgi:hypothetical protein
MLTSIVDWLVANNELIFYGALVFAAAFPAIATQFPFLMQLKMIRLPIPYMGEILFEGALVIGAFLFYMWSIGEIGALNYEVARSVGIGLVTLFLAKNVNAFATG